MKKYILLNFIVALLLLSACSDGENNACVDHSEYLFYREMSNDQEPEMRYFYDNANRLMKIEVYSFFQIINQNVSEIVYEYDSNNNPIKKTKTYFPVSPSNLGLLFDLTTYAYKEDSVFVKIFKTNSEDELSRVDTLIVDINDCLKKVNNSYGLCISNLSYEYNDKKQLVNTKVYNISEDGITQTNETITYIYDDKKGVWTGVNAKQWFFIYELGTIAYISNPIQLKSVVDFTDLTTQEKTQRTYLRKYDYIYNEYGYPQERRTKIVNAFDNSEIEVYPAHLEYVKSN